MTIFYWVMEFVISFIEAFMFFDFCNIFFYKNSSLYLRIGLSALLSIITVLLNSLSLISLLFSLILIVLYWNVQYIIRKSNFFKLLLTTLFYFFFVFIIDFIFSFLTNKIVGIDVESLFLLEKLSYIRLGAAISSKVLLIIIISMMSKFNLVMLNTEKKSKIILATSSIVIILISFFMYLNQSHVTKYKSDCFVFIFFILLLSMVLVIYFTLGYAIKSEQRVKEAQMIMQQSKLLINNMKEQEKTLDLWKQSIHDYKHKMFAINSLLQENNYLEIDKIVQKELAIFKDKAYYINTGCNVVDIIINSKMNYAKENNIVFTVNIMLDKKIPLPDYDLCVILGNLIDNAIEASKNEESPVVHVQMNFVKNLLAITIINSFSKKELHLNTSKSKPDLHGIGLKSVRQIVNNYNGDFSIELKNGHVTAIVII